MKFSDLSPPCSPSPGQQRDSLRKGLGRAMRWALTGRLDDEPLLAACLLDQRFDRQVEDSRGEWLWRMMQAVGATARFRVPILHALYGLSDDSASQLCELAGHYARSGDNTFRTLLYDIVARKPVADSPWLGEEEIVALDGEPGFVFAARVRGRLTDRDWDWDDDHLIDRAIERLGEGRVIQLLADSDDAAIKRFWSARLHEINKRAGRQPVGSHADQMRAVTVNEIISAAEAAGTGFGLFRGWGMHADPADLEAVLQRLWSAHDPKVIASFLKVFSNRALPRFDDRLIGLCRHADAEVRRRAFSALAKNTHGLIREFALAGLEDGVQDGAIVSLFVNNYEPGDERRILDAMELPADGDELHWLLMDAAKVLEKNPEADCSQLGVTAYASTPCENCRFFAIRLLHRQGVIPEWMREECRYDSGEDCRKLVESNLGIDGV